MNEQSIKVPDEGHPITIERNPGRVVVFARGEVIADTERALTLREADHPSVLYIPRRDVSMGALRRSKTASYCPYKGEACHFSIGDEGRRPGDAAWAYDAPYWAVAEIENHVAFNPELVDRIEVR
jgi:uncharacterized protein (DUF427 family)